MPFYADCRQGQFAYLEPVFAQKEHEHKKRNF